MVHRECCNIKCGTRVQLSAYRVLHGANVQHGLQKLNMAAKSIGMSSYM